MKLLKNTLLVIIVSIIFVSCGKGKEEVVTKYDNGKPKLVYYTKTIDGKKQLVYQRMFYPNGKIRFEGSIKTDSKYGVWNYYFENGKKFASVDFTNNKAGNKWEIVTLDSKPLVTINDTLISAGLTADNEIVNISIRQNGFEKKYIFYESFKLKEAWTFKGNILNGQSTAYFENGNVQSIHNYVDGMQDSIYIVYTENGTKLYNGQYKKGIKVGKWDFYNSDGTFARSEIYDENGNRITQ
ncbi:MAG: hypothetical protein LBR28_01615 [Bacteroidales bacterium]|nr:hypothetical protein [Bacteroidales bacterium]